MDEAEAISIANRAHAKKRWAKTDQKKRYEAGRRMTEAREQHREGLPLPRLQDTRTAQVLGNVGAAGEKFAALEAQQTDIWERVSRRIEEEGGDFRRMLLKHILVLEEHAKDYEAAGQKEKATQTSMFLVKQLKEIYLAKEQVDASPSAEEIAAAEAAAEALSDEELERLFKSDKE